MRDEFIRAFADFVADVLERNVVSKVTERFLPRLGVQIHRVHERSVYVEDYRLGHLFSLLLCSLLAWRNFRSFTASLRKSDGNGLLAVLVLTLLQVMHFGADVLLRLRTILPP